ncbi:MAG: aspartate-semialdehyde dehydrogenase [Bacilli bacterium]
MEQTRQFHVAVVGATGAVGEQLLNTLKDRKFPVGKLTLLSSERSAGRIVEWNGKDYTVQVAKPEAFEGVDIALFSAGGSVSRALAKEAIARGAVVVDNTSAFRMDENTPLVVPEVNEKALFEHNGLIANPNCSTIQMVVALQPIREKWGLKKVVVSTYQAVSGAGARAIEELKNQSAQLLKGEEMTANILPCGADPVKYPIAFNAIPQIDQFTANGFTYEEMKMINETKKIMGMPELEVAATCVRLPVMSGHSESLYIEIQQDGVTAEDVKALLKDAPGVVLQDDPANQVYPMPWFATGKYDTFVGRIRQDLDNPRGFHLWVVSDNLLKGAAWNSVQIAERLVALGIVK